MAGHGWSRRVTAGHGGRCADISNVIKDFAVAKHWAVRVTDEFFAQVPAGPAGTGSREPPASASRAPP